jgi:hypothetical protein
MRGRWLMSANKFHRSLTTNPRARISPARSQDEVFSTGEQWKAAMIEKGWR